MALTSAAPCGSGGIFGPTELAEVQAPRLAGRKSASSLSAGLTGVDGANDPGVYFTTPHFDGYPAVLVRLAEISVTDLKELITDAWLTQTPKILAKAFLQNGG